MATPVEMPKLGNTVTECFIAAWRKKKGDQVAAGDVIAEIETDKASFEVTSPAAGIMLEVFFGEGALVPVFTNICVIGEKGESIDAFRPSVSPDGQGAAPLPKPEPANRAASAAPARAQGVTTLVQAEAQPIAMVSAPPAAAPPPPAALSPRARRFAREHGFSPRAVTGSGPGGRVLESDLRNAFFSSPRLSTAAKKHIDNGYEVRGGGSGLGGMILAADLGPPPVRVSTIRERIARRMKESLTGTAQYTLNASADASGLLALRGKFKATTAMAHVTINDLVMFCAIKALLAMPALNAEFINGKLYQHSDVNIGFACDTDRGLMVPVVKRSQDLTIGDLARTLKELATQATQGTLAADDMSGATFTVSNLGSLGIESFTPILNPPQVAILGVDAIQLKPVRKGGTVEFIDSIGLSLTCDHQVIDGAPGARFLKVVKDQIENVETLCTI